MFSVLGSQLVTFALVWWLTKETGSATVLSIATLVGLLPQVILGPFVGTLVDRWNRRVVMILADAATAAATLVLAYLFVLGGIEIWHVYLIMGIRSAASAFHWPAMMASTSLMVPEKHFARIQGVNQMFQGLLNIISGPLGALVVVLMPVYAVLMIDVGTAVIAILPLLFIPIPQPEKKRLEEGTGQEPTTYWQEFYEGLKYVFTWPGLLILILIASIVNLVITPGFSLLPILVTQHFNGEAFQLGWMQFAFGIGVVIGGLVLGIWGGFKRRVITSLVGLIGIGIGVLALGVIPPYLFVAAVGVAFWVGMVNPIANGPLMAAVQAVVEPGIQGRVFTLINSVVGLMTPVGLLLAGPLADAYGVQTWYLVGGLVVLLIAFITFFIPVVVNIDAGKEAKSPVTVEVDAALD